jgi:Tfp pilus assembly protein PilN
MQEINLLQNKVKDRTLRYERSNRVVIGLFTLVLLLEIGAYGGFYYLGINAKSQIAAIKTENTKIQNSMNNNQEQVKLAQGLQAQLKNIRTLLGGHVYWSSFLDQVAAVTPNKIQIHGINGSASDGKFHIEGVGQSYQDIGRLLLALSTSNKFTEVKLRSVGAASGSTFGYSFSMDVGVTPTIFKKQ